MGLVNGTNLKVVLPSSQLKQTTCPYCGVGCGVDIKVTEEQGQAKLTELSGTQEHPANFGRLCVKGSNLLETVDKNDRLMRPEVNGHQVEWQYAINTVAEKFSQTIAQYGPDSVAFYVSGQLLTEDYYVANKLMKGFIGSGNIDTNSRLCMSSAVAAYKKAFGSDSVPCNYEDLTETDLLVLVGSNAAWTHPVLFQRIEKAKLTNPNLKVVVIDPRKTATQQLADLHLDIKPGTDVALFNGLIQFLSKNQGLDFDYIESNTNGFDRLLAVSESCTAEYVADYCDLNIEKLNEFYQWFMQSDKAVTFYSMGVNQSTSGVDKASAIINCHLATGKVGKVGSGPFSITGQPNAMGGREVGGLANMLAAHMDIDNAQHRQYVKTFWNSPTIAKEAGLKAIDLFDKIEQGIVKAVWVMATNPVASLPNRNKIESALKKCEMVVVSDCIAQNDTLDFAHVKLPATGWSEKNGTVTNSERRISRQRGLVEPKGESKHDWQIISEVAKAMGFTQAFNYTNPHQIFSEHAALSAYENNGRRSFDISGLMNLTEREYDNLRPIQWPVNAKAPSGTKRLFSDNHFFTHNNKANFASVVPKLPEQTTTPDFPYVLNSGRIRDQWHTMTRTGSTSTLISHTPQATLSIHPTDAAKYDLEEGDLVVLSSSVTHVNVDQVVLPVAIDSSQRIGELFAPIHWTKTFSSSASIAVLFTDANDSQSGQPELKHAAVNIVKANFERYGELFCLDDINQTELSSKFDYWVKIPIENGNLYRFANSNADINNHQWLDSETAYDESISSKSDDFCYTALTSNQQLKLAWFSAKTPLKIEHSWISSLFAQPKVDSEQLSALIRALPDEKFKQGRMICSCFKVSENTIIDAINTNCSTVEELGEVLGCGTNCGSCKPELKKLLGRCSEGSSSISLTLVES